MTSPITGRSVMLWLVAVYLLFGASASAGGLSKGTLVFVASQSGNWELFMLRAGASTPEQLTNTALDERAPALSPDSKRVAYATSDGALWVMSLDSRAPTRLKLPPGTYGYPCWLADGSGIVYTSYEYTPSGEDADLFVFRFQTASSSLFLLQTGPQDFASLSADGRVAYITSVATTIPGFGSTVTQQLWVASLRTGNAHPLFSGSFRDTRPAWSRDSRSLAFSSDRSGTPEIWVADSDGRKAAQLSTGSGAKVSPKWSPDGSEIAYVSTTSSSSEIEIVDVKTKKPRTITMSGFQFTDIGDLDWR